MYRLRCDFLMLQWEVLSVHSEQINQGLNCSNSWHLVISTIYLNKDVLKARIGCRASMTLTHFLPVLPVIGPHRTLSMSMLLLIGTKVFKSCLAQAELNAVLTALPCQCRGEHFISILVIGLKTHWNSGRGLWQYPLLLLEKSCVCIYIQENKYRNIFSISTGKVGIIEQDACWRAVRDILFKSYQVSRFLLGLGMQKCNRMYLTFAPSLTWKYRLKKCHTVVLHCSYIANLFKYDRNLK